MYRILIAIILMLPTFSHAINYLGFGGGNYVYAEQGNLYFYIDPDAFDNRSWTYDETKGFSAEIKVNMDLKTKYTSDEWLEQVLANKKSDGIMYANYIKQPFNYQNRGNYQQTWFWLARLAPVLGGQISRTASFNAFKRFAASNFGKATNYVALPAFFAFLASDDINCDDVLECKKTYEYTYVSKPETVNSDVLKKDLYATSSEISDKNLLVSRVQANISTTNKWGGTLSSCKIESATSNTVACYYKRSGGITDGYSFGFNKLPAPVTIE